MSTNPFTPAGAASSPAGAPAGDPFALPTGPGSGEKITEYVGALMLVEPTELVESLATSVGVTDAVRANVTLLDGDEPGRLMDNVLVFNMALKRELSKVLAGPNPYLLGRLGKGQAKAGKSAPFIFEPPTEGDMAIARKHLATTAK